MTGPSSQNALSRQPPSVGTRRCRLLVSLLTGLGFLACLMLAVDRIPDTTLGRSVSTHLQQLADPASWMP